jgi:NAD(P)-dependent dehydrogenase (short-subunit alcohol dehydrogenase family)
VTCVISNYQTGLDADRNAIQFSLKGRTAVLSGAARGLGLAFAQALGEAGANIAVLDVIEADPALKQIGSDHGVKVEYYKTDVTSKDQVVNVVEQIKKDFGSIDIKYGRLLADILLAEANNECMADTVKQRQCCWRGER